MKKTMRFLSMALAILLIIQLFPATSLAAKADELRALAQADAAQAAFAPVAYEEVEKRDANTKVFKRKDGSYTAILSPPPLHYKENGAWKEIDNTLERKTVDGRQVLQNRQNAFRVSLPEAVTGKDPVSVTKAGYTLSFTMQEVSGGAPASVKQPSRAEKKAAQEAPEAVQEAKLERQSASLVYEDVQPDTDVEYTVLPQSVKENIILQKAPDGDVLLSLDAPMGGASSPLFFFHMPWIDNEKREYLDTGMTIGKAGEYMTGLYCGIITTYIRMIGLLPYVSK